VAVTCNQILNNGVLVWWWVPIAVAFVLASSGLTAWLTRPGLALAVTDERGRPPLVSQIRLTELGVYPTRFGLDGRSPYLPRDADAELRPAVQRGGVVVVHGHRLVGATRALAHAVIAELPEHRAVVPQGGSSPVVELATLITSAARWVRRTGGVVVWLDGLDSAYLDQLDTALISAVPPGMVVCMTCDSSVVEGRQLRAEPSRLLQQGGSGLAVVKLDVLSSAERSRARRMQAYRSVWDLVDDPDPLPWGEALVAWRELEQLLRPSGRDGPARVALLRLVTDWRRVPMPACLTHTVLKQLYEDYWRELIGTDGAKLVSEIGFVEALAWAQKHRPRLVDRVTVGRGSVQYLPYPLLKIVAEHPESRACWDISDILWDYAVCELPAPDRRRLGVACMDCKDWDHADVLLKTVLDVALDPALMVDLAAGLAGEGRVDAVRYWLQQAIETKHPDVAPTAIHGQGAVAHGRGEFELAQQLYEQVMETKHPDAAPRATYDLGRLRHELGDMEQACHWYRCALETKHSDVGPRAMSGLGRLAVALGEVKQARQWFELAVQSKHPYAALAAMAGLGLLAHELGEIGQAQHWYLRLVETEDSNMAPRAMYDLGRLEHEQGNAKQSRHWLRQAAKTQHPDAAPQAMYDLGIWEDERGEIVQAQLWFQRAVETQHPDTSPAAMHSLGVVADGMGDIVQAQLWFQRAVETQHPEVSPMAMCDLGKLAYEQGDLEAARLWFRQAAANDSNPVMVEQASRGLELIELRLREQDSATRFAAYGYLYSDPRTAPDHRDPTDITAETE
jgi:TPR repeat protein